MRARVSRWGNSLAIRIPAAFAEETHLQDGASVDVSVDDGRLVIAPARPRYQLDTLLAEIAADNLHGETDWGAAEGDETW